MSWKVEVIADSSGKWVSNMVRLPSRETALEYGRDLAYRWTAVREMRVTETPDEPANRSNAFDNVN